MQPMGGLLNRNQQPRPLVSKPERSDPRQELQRLKILQTGGAKEGLKPGVPKQGGSKLEERVLATVRREGAKRLR